VIRTAVVPGPCTFADSLKFEIGKLASHDLRRYADIDIRDVPARNSAAKSAGGSSKFNCCSGTHQYDGREVSGDGAELVGGGEPRVGPRDGVKMVPAGP
jgi:hypothetical protein